MERENRKRGREGDEKQESVKNAKKLDLSYIDDGYLDINDNKEIMSYVDDPCVSGGGVFDFPWLKDGMMIFKTEDCSELESAIASAYSINPDDETYNTILYQSPLNFHEDDKFDVDLSSVFQVDELDNVDCIWSSVIHEPLLTGFNKI